MLQSQERVNTASTNQRKSYLKTSSLYTKTNPEDTLKTKNLSIMTDANNMIISDKITSSVYLDESEIKEYEALDSKIDQTNNFEYSLNPGDKIYKDTIEIIKLIGTGGQASVHLGKINERDKFVAVKHYQKNISEEEEIQKIRNDIEKLKKLNHNNIVYYYDLDIQVVGNICNIYIIMEYLERNLADFLDWYKEENKLKYLPLDLVSYISRNIVQGLAYLHQNNIINRDLKPENILLNKDLSDIKITDFGISTNVKHSKTFIKRTNLLATPFYTSPDILFGKPYGYDCDIWSLGCVVFELVAGEKPHIKIANQNGYGLAFANYSSPLETADDDVLDIIYDRKNRNLLDFLQKCWRGNNKFRPSAKELLNHKFLEIKNK